MKVLMLSSDVNILKEGSEPNQRMLEYGKLFEKLDIIVFSKKVNKGKIKISENTFLHPTNSKSKLCYIMDAVKIGKKLEMPDVVSSQDPFEIGVAAYKIAKHLKTKLQLQIHTDFLSPHFKKDSLKNKIRVFIARYLLPKADSIRVVSERIRDSLSDVKCQMSNVVVLPIFVDVEKFKNAEIKTDLHIKYPQFNFIILMASRLTKEKNIGLAIEAMGRVIKKYSKIGLIIVGSGQEEKKLKTKSYQPERMNSFSLAGKLKANIVFESWTEDLASYYKTVDLFLLTSNYEGYGRTIAESLAAGTPVISTDVGAAKELGAFIVDMSVDSICKKIEEFIENTKEVNLKPSYSSKEEYLQIFKSQFDKLH